jgi:hypothetical protein
MSIQNISGKAFLRTLLGWSSESLLFWFGRIGAVFRVLRLLGCTFMSRRLMLDCVWNVMAHAQKPDFVFRRNGRVHLNRGGRQFSGLLAAEVCASAVVNAGYTMFRGSLKGTGYPLHSPVSLSLPLPCITVSHYISTRRYISGIARSSPAWLTRCTQSADTFMPGTHGGVRRRMRFRVAWQWLGWGVTFGM